jgi:hypothetical protein
MVDHHQELLSVCWKRKRQPIRSRPVLVKPPADARLTTAYLIGCATRCIRKERASGAYVPNAALLVLQHRADDEVLEAALRLLRHSDAAARQLGALILREFPGLDLASYSHAHRAIEHLERMIATERDDDVLEWALSAIGWQKHPAATAVLLRFVDDPRASVRYKVANNLYMAFADIQLPAAVAQVLLRFAQDPDRDIRWSVFYDVAEHPQLFEAHRAAFLAAAQAALRDDDTHVREQARRAVDGLG